jgi:hypothetical protein
MIKVIMGIGNRELEHGIGIGENGLGVERMHGERISIQRPSSHSYACGILFLAEVWRFRREELYSGEFVYLSAGSKGSNLSDRELMQ